MREDDILDLHHEVSELRNNVAIAANRVLLLQGERDQAVATYEQLKQNGLHCKGKWEYWENSYWEMMPRTREEGRREGYSRGHAAAETAHRKDRQDYTRAFQQEACARVKEERARVEDKKRHKKMNRLAVAAGVAAGAALAAICHFVTVFVL